MWLKLAIPQFPSSEPIGRKIMAATEMVVLTQAEALLVMSERRKKRRVESERGMLVPARLDQAQHAQTILGLREHLGSALWNTAPNLGLLFSSASLSVARQSTA